MKHLTLFLCGLTASCVVSALSIGPQSPLQDPTSKSSSALIQLHKAIVEHSSITGTEHNVSQWLTNYLESKDFTVEKQTVSKGRENLFAYVGKSRKTKILVSSHIDTVPPFWPYERRDNEIWGRGSVDAKGSVASQIIAVEELLETKQISEGDVSLLYVVGEEVGGDGMRKANDLGLTWETAIFGEPTELKLASGHKGNLGFTIKATGKAGHSGYPELGRNANSMLVPVLYALSKLQLPWSEKYGNTTLNIGKIDGGVAANVIAEEAVANCMTRIADGPPEVVRKLVEDALESVCEDYCDKFEVTFTPGYGPVAIDHDVPGFGEIVVNYGTDIPNLKGEHKRYLYGPGDILVAHSDHEHLKISDLETAVEGYKTLIMESLK